MRRFFLPLTFLTLVAAIYFLWQHRFERSPGIPTIRLADLRAPHGQLPGVEWLGSEERPRLRLRVDRNHPRPVATRMDLPGMEAIDRLHLRFQLAATNLTPAKQIWDDGRCIIE